MNYRLRNTARALFFGNYFYGVCVVALSIEALLQQGIAYWHFPFFGILFCSTVLYYSWAYTNDRSGYPFNEQRTWYQQHAATIRYSQWLLLFIDGMLVIWFFLQTRNPVFRFTITEWICIFIFPLTAIFYYGIGANINLRKIGWMKPFIIGFTWAGVVTWYPVMDYQLQQKSHFQPGTISFLLLVKNFMFISVLCILFDIKDFAADSNRNLQTFIVRTGLRRTIFFIVIPLVLVGLGTYVIYAIFHGFKVYKTAINVLPFLLLIMVSYSLKKRKPLLYYFIFIDGLMLVKGICGSLAILF
jgi:hypothetical protein